MILPETIYSIIQLTLALVLGLFIGAEREHRKKPAGLRTYALVALGAALFTIMSTQGFFGPNYDPSRIASQVVVGIGFIGGGLIFFKGEKLEGLTTAAGLWATAAIGMAVGFEFYTIAVYATILVIFVLWALKFFEDRIHKNERRID